MSAQSEPLWLRPDVQMTLTNGDAVFLKVSTDSYFCLPQVGEDLRLGPDRRTVQIGDASLAAALRTAGILSPKRRAAEFGDILGLRPGQASALRDDFGRPGLGDTREVFLSLIDLMRHYRGRPLAHLLRAVAQSRPAQRSDPDALIRVVQGFHRWAPFAPVSGKCLLRSFMLLRRLHAHGLDAQWVFGVRTWPFRAHCWLQHGETVLDDHPERVAAYAPILVA